MILKHQEFEDSGSDKMEPRNSKHQQFDLYDNKKEKGLDKFEIGVREKV